MKECAHGEYTKTYSIDEELEAALHAAALTGESVLLKGTRTYRLRIEEAAEPVEPSDIFVDYDPEKVRAALKTAAGIFTREEGDEIVESICRGREVGIRPIDRP